MAIETDITKLVFNKLSNEKYEELKANGELVNNEFYITPDSKEDFDDEVPTKVSQLENDLGFITTNEVNELIENIDIPEQTPNIKGGEYIDVIEPKGETLYEYDVLDMMLTQYGTSTCNNIILNTNVFDYDGLKGGDFEFLDVTQNDIYYTRIPSSYAEYLVPALKSDKTQYTLNEIISNDYLTGLKDKNSNVTVDTIEELIQMVSNDNVDYNTPMYILKLQQDPIIALAGVYQDKNGNYMYLAPAMYDITPINTIVSEPSDKSLTIDFNEKALEMIENTGSDITTNGWNIFDHKFSDHLLNDPSWVRSDTFSWQDGGIYFTAYEELEKENNGRIEPSESFETWYAWKNTNIAETLYINKEIPEIGDVMMTVSGDAESGYTFTETDNTVVDYNSGMVFIKIPSLEGGDVPAIYESGCEAKSDQNIVIDNSVEGNLLTDTYEDITITYYKSANGLKICLQDQADAIEQLYANTGVAWYYIIDTENKRFKLPRSKWNFVGSRGNVGAFVDESLPNITGSVEFDYQCITNTDGSFSRTGQAHHTNWSATGSSGTGDNGLLSVDASHSSSTYQDNAPVQQRATEMYLYFFMGDTLRDARIIDVNAVVENQASVTNELDALKNLLATIDYVVESKLPTEEDPTWYRVYKSGWVEQGGVQIITGASSSTVYTDIQLLKEMNNNFYTANISMNESGNYWAQSSFTVHNKTISNFSIGRYTIDNGTCVDAKFSWEVKGQGA